MIEVNAKVDRISNKKVESMLEVQRPSSLKDGLGYIKESSSSDLKISAKGLKSVKFISAKTREEKEKSDDSLNEKKRKELAPKTPKVKETTSTSTRKGKAMTKSHPKKQRGPQTPHLCHHCGARGHTRPNCFMLHALKKNDPPRVSSSLSNNDGLLKQVVAVLSPIATHLSVPCNSHGNPNPNSNLTPCSTPSRRGCPTWVRRGSQT